MLVRLLALAVVLGLAAPAAAHGYSWPTAYTSVAHNPADALADSPLEPSTYDTATHCSKRPKPGTLALVAWLQHNARGVFWGSYRCEKWGPKSASLHAENRAVDWHLDVDVPAQRREAERLIALFLAPDRLGQPQALPPRRGAPARRSRPPAAWPSRRSSGTAATGGPAWTSSARMSRACPSTASSA